MKTPKPSLFTVFLAPVLLALFAVGFAFPTRAQGEAPKPPHLRVSLALENDHLLLGEPVVLHYSIRTDSKATSLPFEQKAPWLHVELQDEGGKIVASTNLTSLRGISGQSLQSGYFHEERQEIFGLDLRNPYEDSVLLGGRRFGIPYAGTYKVVVRVTSLWSAIPETFVRDPHGTRGRIFTEGELGKLRKPKHLLSGLPVWAVEASRTGQWDEEFPVNQRVVIPLTVTRNDAKMVQKIKQLREQIQEAVNPEWKYAQVSKPTIYLSAVQSLFSLYGKPAQQAQEYYAAERAAKHTLWSLMNHVGRSYTPEAIDFIADYTWNHGYREGEGELAAIFLLADHDLQDYIAEQFARHSSRFPERLIWDGNQ